MKGHSGACSCTEGISDEAWESMFYYFNYIFKRLFFLVTITLPALYYIMCRNGS